MERSLFTTFRSQCWSRSRLCIIPHFIYSIPFSAHLYYGKNLNLPISILLFVDDDLFIVQNKSLNISNSNLFCSYNILSKLLDSFGLIIEHSKTEIFHFNRSHGPFNPPPLDLSPLGDPILKPKESWRYLGFIFDWKLSFHNYIDHYTNKAL